MKKSFYLLFFALSVILNSPGFVFPQPKPYVILVSFDAFRWDYPDRGLTPNLDYMKSNGASALSLRPAFPSKTFPNHQSIITGMYPEHHGIIHNDFTDPFTGDKYRLSDTVSSRDSRWYLGEAFWETAERQGIKTASYFWPGSELTLSYRRPSYYMPYEHKRSYFTILDGVIDWLKLPGKDRPHFITMYVHETDDMGHRFGPGSPEVNKAIRLEDSLVGLIFSKLKEINMLDSTNVIVLSDHGMTDVTKDREINIEEITGQGNKLDGTGPIVMIEPAKENLNEVYNKLKSHENHYKVYTKENIPEYYHFNDHPFIYSLVVIAEPGWSLTDNRAAGRSNRYEGKGNHGYDNNYIDMHGIFYAMGPAFKKAYRTGTLWNVDVYPLLCRIFNIYPRQNIDGRLERIEFLLK